MLLTKTKLVAKYIMPLATTTNRALSTFIPNTAVSESKRVANDGLRGFIEKITERPREARIWLKYFQRSTEPDHPFAIMQLAKCVLEDSNLLSGFIWQAAFLQQNGLKSVLVLDNSTEELMQQVVTGLAGQGVSTRQLNQQASAYQVRASLLEGHCPLINASRVDKRFELLPCTISLSIALRPLKVMLLNSDQGLVNEVTKVVLGDIVLPSDLVSLQKEAWFANSKQDQRVQHIANFLHSLPHESSVIITRANTVIQELFTHHGVGTMLRRTDKIIKHNSFADVDCNRLHALLESSFKRKLRTSYFEDIAPHVRCVYVSEHFGAAAVILSEEGVDVPYLDKVAVEQSSQGNGLAAQLWNEVVKDYPQLFWRSRKTNRTALQWYYTVSQGAWKDERNWTVFWYGLESAREVWRLVEHAIEKPEDFI